MDSNFERKLFMRTPNFATAPKMIFKHKQSYANLIPICPIPISAYNCKYFYNFNIFSGARVEQILPDTLVFLSTKMYPPSRLRVSVASRSDVLTLPDPAKRGIPLFKRFNELTVLISVDGRREK
jgi:hypothetical protein